MVVYDENDNIIENPDLTKGIIRGETRIKPGASPIDNKKKFAYYDNDYEDIMRYIPYTKEDIIEAKRSKIYGLKSLLSGTDYVASKAMDKMITCTTPEEMEEVANEFRTEYGGVIEQRQQWRDEVNRLQGELNKLSEKE